MKDSRFNLTPNLPPDEVEKLSAREQEFLRERETPIRAALEQCMYNAKDLREKLIEEKPIWYETFAPLTHQERTVVLLEMCKILEVPVPKFLRMAVKNFNRHVKEWGI